MYSLELQGIIERIKEKKYKKVLIQLPDGLKPKAKEIVDEIAKHSDAEVLIWLGNCYGGCDVPLGIEQLEIDFLVQWGHNHYRKTKVW